MKSWVYLTTFIVLIATRAMAVYGTEPADLFTSDRLELIKKATAAIVTTENLRLKEIPSLNEIYKFCGVEKYLEQKLWANCSGVLISKDIILTAGHCIASHTQCPEKSFVFDFLTNDDIPRLQSNLKNVFQCKKVIFWSQPILQKNLVDFALIQLDRSVDGRTPIKLSVDPLTKAQDIFASGHPLGLPLKISVGYVSQKNAEANLLPGKSFYSSQMASHPGLSGAGVYNSDQNLVGLLVRGESNIESDDGRCQRIKTCDSENCPWAEIQKLDVKLIEKLIKKSQNSR